MWKHTLLHVERQNAVVGVASVGIGWCSTRAFFPTSMSFRIVFFFSLLRLVYSLIRDFSAFKTEALSRTAWTLGPRCTFFLFHAYRGMHLCWGSSTSIWAEERSCTKYLWILHIPDFPLRGSRRALGPQWKLLSTSDSNHYLYAQKGSFNSTPGQARQPYNKHCLSG